MKKIFYSAAFCAAALAGFPACSSDNLDVPAPADRVVAIVNGEAPVVSGPTSIELDRLYTFSAQSPVAGDTFTFTVEDTYFNDPRSYGINVSQSGVRINVVFNDYGRYKITAKSNKTGFSASYEVAKYYKGIRNLKYVSNAPSLADGVKGGRPVVQWFERYADYSTALCEFRGRITNFEERIVVDVEQKCHEYWYSGPSAPCMKEGNSFGTVTGIAAKGANTITLPDAYPFRHPKYNAWTLDNNAWFMPYCADRVYTIPEERCGSL